MTALGVLYCFALFVCLTLLASFFLPSHLSLKNMYIYTCTCTCTYAHVCTYMYIVHVDVNVHVHVYMHVYTYNHVDVHVYRCTCMSLFMFSCSSKQKSRRSSLSKLFGRKNKRRGGSQKHGFKRFSEPVPRHGTHVGGHVCVCTCTCRKSDCLGCAVLLCLVCLFDLACFFLSSFSSLI